MHGKVSEICWKTIGKMQNMVYHVTMLYRKTETVLNRFKSGNKALLVTGARQVGKSYLIREFGQNNFESYIEINFIKNETALRTLSNIKDTDDLFIRLSALADKPLIRGKTLFFFDEVQEIPDLITHIKFLVEDGRYRYILSGSMLGVELKEIRSVPVGYMDTHDMYPLDFEEFMIANNVQPEVIKYLEECYKTRKPVDDAINERFLKLFNLYLIIGGMPEAVQKYVDTHNLREVQDIQSQIIHHYMNDISKYDKEDKLYISDVFEKIPAELNSKNKRFILKELNQKGRFEKYRNTFLWLKNAGVALPVHIAEDPKAPLELSEKTNLFKLFLNDVGLLASMYEKDGIQLKILNGELNINSGAIFENAAAQELKAHNFPLFYYNSKKNGEVDFLIELEGKVLPLEIKSGKDYMRHNALSNLLSNNEFNIKEAFVLAHCNVRTDGPITYLPIYMLSFLQRPAVPENLIYDMDMSDITVPD